MTASAIVEEILPCPQPMALVRQLAHLPYLLFLDSSEYHADRGRYSFLMADPVQWFRHDCRQSAADPFEMLKSVRQAIPTPTLPDLPPFQGGLAGLFGYGLSHAIEKLPRPRFDEFQLPDLGVGLYEWVIAWDHLRQRAWIIVAGFAANPEETLKSVRRQIADDRKHPKPPEVANARRGLPLPASPQYPLIPELQITSNFDRSGYERAVAQTVEYIHAGDCFQINLSQRLLCPAKEPPLELYARLRERNPAPFSAYFDLGEAVLISASPERFLKVQNREVETRPIKGTRRRGSTPAEESALIADLRSSAKDRAENIMIVDLLRNDIGKVCDFGSVRVTKIMEVETFRYVHHLVSEVRGRLRDHFTAEDLLRGAFPGGSVTGAPKVRSMEIIAELEPTARGPYCGSLGYIGADGTMDTNILIRTFTQANGWLQFPVGGGIVADSDPAREYEETLHKAEGLLRALRGAE